MFNFAEFSAGLYGRLFLLAEARFYEKIIKNVADCLPDYQPASGILLLIQAVEEKMSALIKKLLNYLLIGILAVIPIVLILQIIIFVKDRVADLFQLVYGYSVSYVYTSLIFAVSFIILVSIGRQIAKQGRPWFIAAFEHVIERIPFLNTVYRVIKKVINMFSSHDKSIAKEVVYVEYPKDGIWVPAYVTNRFNEKYVLFVPTSPNPTSGFTVIVDKSKIIRSNMNIEEATSFIVSVGVDFNKDTEVSQLPR